MSRLSSSAVLKSCWTHSVRASSLGREVSLVRAWFSHLWLFSTLVYSLKSWFCSVRFLSFSITNGSYFFLNSFSAYFLPIKSWGPTVSFGFELILSFLFQVAIIPLQILQVLKYNALADRKPLPHSSVLGSCTFGL